MLMNKPDGNRDSPEIRTPVQDTETGKSAARKRHESGKKCFFLIPGIDILFLLIYNILIYMSFSFSFFKNTLWTREIWKRKKLFEKMLPGKIPKSNGNMDHRTEPLWRKHEKKT